MIIKLFKFISFIEFYNIELIMVIILWMHRQIVKGELTEGLNSELYSVKVSHGILFLSDRLFNMFENNFQSYSLNI